MKVSSFNNYTVYLISAAQTEHVKTPVNAPLRLDVKVHLHQKFVVLKSQIFYVMQMHKIQ